MIKNTILLVLYLLQFYLNSLRGKEYLAKLVRSWSRFFGPFEPESEPEPLEKPSNMYINMYSSRDITGLSSFK